MAQFHICLSNSAVPKHPYDVMVCCHYVLSLQSAKRTGLESTSPLKVACNVLRAAG